jgi:hypothetical protein
MQGSGETTKILSYNQLMCPNKCSNKIPHVILAEARRCSWPALMSPAAGGCLGRDEEV